MFVPYLVKESPSQPAGDLEALEAGKTKKKVAVNPMTTCSVLFTTDHSRTGAYLGVRMQARTGDQPAEVFNSCPTWWLSSLSAKFKY